MFCGSKGLEFYFHTYAYARGVTSIPTQKEEVRLHFGLCKETLTNKHNDSGKSSSISHRWVHSLIDSLLPCAKTTFFGKNSEWHYSRTSHKQPPKISCFNATFIEWGIICLVKQLQNSYIIVQVKNYCLINLLTPKAFCQKHIFWTFWRLSGCTWAKLAPIYSKKAFATRQHAFLSTSFAFYNSFARPCAEIKKWPTSLFFLLFFWPFLFLLFLSFCCTDWPSTGLAPHSKTSGKASSRWAIFAME